MLRVHHSNRVEQLLERLDALLAEVPEDPFAPEMVAVQNPGMGRWLAQQLALRGGIAANLEFPLPAALAWRLLRLWFPDLPESQGMGKEAILWHTLALLPGQLGDPAFSELARYLHDDPDGLRRYQLGRRIADLFDQYLVYRPDWVLGWEAGRDGHWQARLWRAIREACPQPHWAGVVQRLFTQATDGAAPEGALPPRLSLFGLTALSPSYLGVLQAVALHTEVHVFLLNPCQEYWADILDEKGQARRRARSGLVGRGADAGSLLDLGNPLLASLGHAGQELLDQLLDAGSLDEDAFVDPGDATLLRRLQADILKLRDSRNPDPRQRVMLGTEDRSVQVHVCHSPMREVQVLHDQLLRLFEELRDLQPRDIVVMAPDIDRYAPMIAAVFASADAGLEIPWAIADRRLRMGLPVLEALGALLDLPASRLEASGVLGLLEVPALQRRFGLDLAGVERIRAWARESGVRWGSDAAMRLSLGLPAEPANTWDFGLDRLFLGYALPPGTDLFHGVAPYADVEGSSAADLGALAELLDRLSRWRQRLQRQRTASGWRRLIFDLIEDFFDPDEEEAEGLQYVRTSLEALERQAVAAAFNESLSLAVVRDQLLATLDSPRGSRHFLTGRVTFCSLVPMRSIPFRVVCLLGLNAEDFPRHRRPLGFDLIAQEPRRGDRSRRQDDRYLFLEALLSARDRLYLSYVGHDIRDNSLKVPSAPLGELIEYLERSFVLPNDASPAQHLTLAHPLQPFSTRYFDGSDPRLFSYSRGWLAAARVDPWTEKGADAFALAPLPPPVESAKDRVELADLIRFLCNPAAHFLRNRLGLRLPEEPEALADTEPFDLAGLERHGLRQRLLALAASGEDQQGILARLRGEGTLPHGAFGGIWVEDNRAAAEAFLARWAELRGDPRDPLDVDLSLGGLWLGGQLRDLGSRRLVRARFARLKAKDQLRLWVHHLVLNTLAPAGLPLFSTHLADPAEVHLRPVDGAAAVLADLLHLYREGLDCPLPFFPETSLHWLRNGPDASFWTTWRGNPHNPNPADQDDPWVRIAFRGVDPFDATFEALAQRIYGPLLAAVESPAKKRGD